MWIIEFFIKNIENGVKEISLPFEFGDCDASLTHSGEKIIIVNIFILLSFVCMKKEKEIKIR